MKGVCPSGTVNYVSHMARGRSAEANKQIEEWLMKISDRQVAGRVAAAFKGALCADDKEMLLELGRMAKSPQADLRSETVSVLRHLGGKEARRMVRDALMDESPAVRLKALYGISYACDHAALPEVERLIATEQSEEVLRVANKIAHELKGPVPCIPLPELSTDPL